jgi:hypothetical protein
MLIQSLILAGSELNVNLEKMLVAYGCLGKKARCFTLDHIGKQDVKPSLEYQDKSSAARAILSDWREHLTSMELSPRSKKRDTNSETASDPRKAPSGIACRILVILIDPVYGRWEDG